jgi:hypothetical protein
MSRTCVVIAPAAAYKGPADIGLDIHAEPGDVSLKKTVRLLGPDPSSLQSETPSEQP